jgi:hypothetical protein
MKTKILRDLGSSILIKSLLKYRDCVATQEKSDSEVNVDSKELKQKLTSIENYERLG